MKKWEDFQLASFQLPGWIKKMCVSGCLLLLVGIFLYGMIAHRNSAGILSLSNSQMNSMAHYPSFTADVADLIPSVNANHPGSGHNHNKDHQHRNPNGGAGGHQHRDRPHKNSKGGDNGEYSPPVQITPLPLRTYNFSALAA